MEQIVTLENSRLRDTVIVFAASVLIALCAPISIPLPFTPVPIALQSHVCLFLGAFLGARRGALAVCIYLLQGAIGFPVFALGKSGILHLLGPTGGYLLGYALAAYVVGYLVERMRGKTASYQVLAMAVGNGIICFFGVTQLSVYLGFQSAIVVGVLPFILGDLLKLILAYHVWKRIRRLL